MRTEDELPTDAEARAIYAKACAEIAELNQGKEPTRFREWAAIGRRFGIRWHIVPSLASPAFFYDEDQELGDLFLPRSRDRRQVHVWIMHEMIEFLYAREICATFLYPKDWGSDHDMAALVHNLHAARLAA